jgi:hypothetical protein
MLNKYTAAAVVAGSMLAGGALGVAVFAPHLAGASSTPTPAVSQSTPAPSASNGSTFQSNEDQAHEANESPQREADENSGKAFRGDHGHGRGFGHGGSNEDPAHEASESKEREAQEDANNGGQQTSPPAAAPSGSTAQ